MQESRCRERGGGGGCKATLSAKPLQSYAKIYECLDGPSSKQILLRVGELHALEG